jgi:tetratricopeptide (TPR) repeat protein
MFPDRSIEVINLGLTATNSYTVNDLAAEVVALEPDLLLVYDGHNEFYGALGAASQESGGGARWLIKAYLRLVHFRTFLLLRDLYARVRVLFTPALSQAPPGTMMERLARGQYVPHDSPIYRTVLSNFVGNLHELTEMARKHHIPLILGTQVSNLRDLPPFVSGAPPGLSAAEQGRLAPAFLDSVVNQPALGALYQDTLVAPTHARLRYAVARGLERARQYRQADRQYRLARDYDELRFRCSSEFNEAIQRAGNVPGTRIVDFERVFSAQSPDSIVGHTLITEHLHPNARGYFLMAKAYASAIRSCGLLAPDEEWAKRDTVPDETLWADRPLTDLDSLCAEKRTRLLTGGWPFRDSMIVGVPIGSDEISRIAEKMVHSVATWEEGHVAAAEWYEAHGEIRSAAREYRALINQIPLNVSPYLRLGKLYAQAGKPDSAESVLQRSLALQRTSFALRTLGAILVTRDRFEAATLLLNEALPLCATAQEAADTRYLLAFAWARARNREQALRELDRLFAIAPGHANGRHLEEQLRRSP